MKSDANMDCGFSTDSDWFRYRAAAIIIENNCVLLASNDVSNYFYSVGGGVHVGEKAEDAVIREVFEETGIHYEIDRLVVIHENFFCGNGITEGKLCHEIAFYFLMKPKGSQSLNSNSFCAEGREYMTWIPISELKNHPVYPTFFQKFFSIFRNTSRTSLQKNVRILISVDGGMGLAALGCRHEANCGEE